MREKKDSGGKIARLHLTRRNRQTFCYEDSQVVPARPSGKGTLKVDVRSRKVRVIRSGAREK